MKIYIKSILKLIKSNFSRFITLILIVMLGVGFLVGLFSVAPDLELTASKEFNAQKMSEVYLRNTSGFTDDDIDFISSLLEEDSLKEIRASFENDINVSVNNEKQNGRVIYQDINDNNQDVLKLIEGTKELGENEILVEQSGSYLKAPSIGSNIVIGAKTYKIVGIVSNPWYMMKERYNSEINQTTLDIVCYLPLSEKFNFELEKEVKIYTNLYLYFGFDNANQFDKSLKNKISSLTDKLDESNEEITNFHEKSLKRMIKDQVVLGFFEKMSTQIIGGSKENYYKNGEISVFGNKYNYDKIEVLLNNENSLDLEGMDKYLYDNLKPEVDKAYDSFTTTQTDKFGKVSNFYNLTRYESNGVILFDMYLDKIRAVSYIFPLFFFIITSLVTLTSLRRLIFEERSQIGTMRAIGYSKLRVFNRYLTFGLLGTLIGSLLGILLGIWLIPNVVYSAYITTMHLPELIYSFNIFNNLMLLLLMLIIITLVIFLTISNTLKENPNTLLTPKAPPKGRRILLERVGFIWNHLKFKYKSTIRNMIRYKRNLIMMLIGVGGCAALVLLGFGLKDSIDTVANKEFNDIVLYDGMADITENEIADEKVISSYQIYYDEFKYEDYPVKTIVGDESLNDYFNFNLKKEKDHQFKENDVLISEKLAIEYKINVGDSINYKDKDYKVTGVFENYIDNYLIINSNLADYKANKQIFKTYDLTNEEEKALAERLVNNNMVTQISFVSSLSSAYDSLIGNMNLIIVVVVVFAAILALVVIFNLININVSEREREIATLKVLGYSSFECHGYIARETFILTFIGIGVGLLLGFGLHQFVASVIDTTTLMAGRQIYWQSYVLTAFLTLIFAVIVDLCYIPHYKKISMTESLKAVE